MPIGERGGRTYGVVQRLISIAGLGSVDCFAPEIPKQPEPILRSFACVVVRGPALTLMGSLQRDGSGKVVKLRRV